MKSEEKTKPTCNPNNTLNRCALKNLDTTWHDMLHGRWRNIVACVSGLTISVPAARLAGTEVSMSSDKTKRRRRARWTTLTLVTAAAVVLALNNLRLPCYAVECQWLTFKGTSVAVVSNPHDTKAALGMFEVLSVINTLKFTSRCKSCKNLITLQKFTEATGNRYQLAWRYKLATCFT